MAKEIERAGIPTALITAMVSVAVSVGTPRIVAAQAIVHPTGNPRMAPEVERRFRRRLVELALQAVAAPVQEPQVFSLPPSEAPDEATGVAVGGRWLH